jgi:NDP-sugar pyrophosphorylase family protein
MLLPGDFFDLDGYEHKGLFTADQPVWTVLDRLKDYIESLFKNSWPLKGCAGMVEKPIVIADGAMRYDLSVRPAAKGAVQAFDGDSPVQNATIIMQGAYLNDDRVIIGPGTVVEPGALIKGPTVVGSDTEVRQGAYIRGDCLIGNKCVVGHTTEIKSSVMLDGAKAGHFAYIGDSILGKDVNLGAGTKLANLKMIPGNIFIRDPEGNFHKTGRRKLGAILGDRTETGCNSVTSPGTLMESGSVVLPTISVPGGYYQKGSCVMPRRGSIDVRSNIFGEKR